MYNFDPSDFVKVPGYIPLSELPQVLDLEGDSIVIRIGSLDDGTPLFEVFRGAPIIEHPLAEVSHEE